MPYRPIPELAIEQRGPVASVTPNSPDMRNAFSDAEKHRSGASPRNDAVDGAMVERATA